MTLNLDSKELARRYKDRARTGENATRLAEIYNCSVSAIHNRLKAEGVKMKRLRTVMTPEMSARVEALIAEGLSQREISRRLGVNSSTIRKYFQFNTIVRRHRAALNELLGQLELHSRSTKDPKVKERSEAQMAAIRFVML